MNNNRLTKLEPFLRCLVAPSVWHIGTLLFRATLCLLFFPSPDTNLSPGYFRYSRWCCCWNQSYSQYQYNWSLLFPHKTYTTVYFAFHTSDKTETIPPFDKNNPSAIWLDIAPVIFPTLFFFLPRFSNKIFFGKFILLLRCTTVYSSATPALHLVFPSQENNSKQHWKICTETEWRALEKEKREEFLVLVLQASNRIKPGHTAQHTHKNTHTLTKQMTKLAKVVFPLNLHTATTWVSSSFFVEKLDR